MKHTILFDQCDNHASNALPLGNGTFGCMPFYELGHLFLPMNHYEVYYTTAENNLPQEILDAMGPIEDAGEKHRRFLKRAEENQAQEGEPFCLYRTDRAKALQATGYGSRAKGVSNPPTGELCFTFAPALSAHRLSLTVEEAKSLLELSHQEKSLRLETLVTRTDCILTKVTPSHTGLLTEITLSLPHCREMDTPDITFEQQDEQTVLYTVRRTFSAKKEFTFCGILRFDGATVNLRVTKENEALLQVTHSAKSFYIFTGIFTDYRFSNPKDAALEAARQWDPRQLEEEHRNYWTDFFARTRVRLPDPFLEKIYYTNLYALDCSSGKDGVMKHQACGLNGLWAIRHPNIWGSMWYWDVNIQSAFIGVFSSNRPELGKVFSDGLLSYRALARRCAKEIHDMEGCATDYPFHFYYSCWMWCAQYLWYLYEYTLDREYLKRDAYPLFLELCTFILHLFQYDEERDCYTVFPDISPEQGPLAHNTTITVSCAKYLLTFTLKAAEILGDRDPLLERCRALLAKLPPYALSKDGKYGVHLKDSEDAPDELWLRHPSLLMPLFPIGEFDLSDPSVYALLTNSLDYAEETCELGIFGCSWIAAAAARLGKGGRALRLLYEKGIDHMLRSNGLAAEETERFMNFCLLGRQPLYYPCMMEFSGGMLAAVNELLLQSYDGLIRVFPALPDGDPEFERLTKKGYSVHEYNGRFSSYAAWKNVSFDRLLAKGAFEVSAALHEGQLQFIQVQAQQGGLLRLTCPYLTEDFTVFCNGEAVPYEQAQNLITLETQKGCTYLFAPSASVPTEPEQEQEAEAILLHETFTRRKISIGENAETLYHKKVDAFLRDRYLGNRPIAPNTVYKFDFTEKAEKDYAPAIPLYHFLGEEHLLSSMDFVRLGAEPFTPRLGYGFADPKEIRICSRKGPDAMREDFAEGTLPAEFIIEAPRGMYELLAVSGDAEEDSATVIQVQSGQPMGGKMIPKGTFQCLRIPLILEEDSAIRVKLSSHSGHRWKLNGLLLNFKHSS